MKIKMTPFIPILLILIGLFISMWTFNHIDAWIGLLFAGIVVALAINYLFNKFKNL